MGALLSKEVFAHFAFKTFNSNFPKNKKIFHILLKILTKKEILIRLQFVFPTYLSILLKSIIIYLVTSN